jgi:hypothetical protein
LLILWDPVANILASLAVKSRSMPPILLSGSQKFFVLVNTGAVAGADRGKPKRSADVEGKDVKSIF